MLLMPIKPAVAAHLEAGVVQQAKHCLVKQVCTTWAAQLTWHDHKRKVMARCLHEHLSQKLPSAGQQSKTQIST